MYFKSDDVETLAEWTYVESLGTTIHTRRWQSRRLFGAVHERGGRPATSETIPIVLIAGLGISGRYWARFGRRLSYRLGGEFGGQYEVLAPDMPGFGRSPKVPRVPWPGGPSAGEQADQLLAWMDARGIQQAILCGHSTGCQTVVDLARRASAAWRDWRACSN